MSQEKFTDIGMRIDALIDKAGVSPSPTGSIAVFNMAFSCLDRQGLRPEDYGINEDGIRGIVERQSGSPSYKAAVAQKTQELINLYFNK
ncbi:MAG: hypothetical protein Q8P53_03550 [Candidatus Shapirobacteria bacterium]|nr:hypothetical protein [Candidatus Shapirobacteria bacterium]